MKTKTKTIAGLFLTFGACGLCLTQPGRATEPRTDPQGAAPELSTEIPAEIKQAGRALERRKSEREKAGLAGMPAARPREIIDSVIALMRGARDKDGENVGPAIAEFIDHIPGPVEFRSGLKNSMEAGIAEPVPENTVLRTPYIQLRDELAGASPRYLAVLLADGAGRLMEDSMFQCPGNTYDDCGLYDVAETRYMRLSQMARVWIELGGGNPSQPPYFDGVKDEAAAKGIALWLEINHRDIEGAANALGRGTLAGDLMSYYSARENELTARLAALKPGSPYSDGNELRHQLQNAQRMEKQIGKQMELFHRFREQEERWLKSRSL